MTGQDQTGTTASGGDPVSGAYEKIGVLARKTWVRVLAVLVLIGIIFTVFVYTKMNNLRDRGIDLETQLSAQYLDNQNVLGSYISTPTR
jgi:hypothetical protein